LKKKGEIKNKERERELIDIINIIYSVILNNRNDIIILSLCNFVSINIKILLV